MRRWMVRVVAAGVLTGLVPGVRAADTLHLNDLALRAMRSAWTPETGGVISTLGLFKSLGLLHTAARGATEAQLQSFFRHEPNELIALIETVESRIPFRTGIGLWWTRQVGDTTAFQQWLDRFEGVTNAAVDFVAAPDAVVSRINEWGDHATGGAMPALLDPFRPTVATRLIVADATVCALDLSPPHGHAISGRSGFTTPGGETIDIPTMTAFSVFRSARIGDVTVCELPTQHTNVVVLLLAPPTGKLVELMNQLNSDTLQGVDARLTPTRAILMVPEFEISNASPWQERLARLGLGRLLSGQTADISGIDGNPGWLYLSHMVHGVAFRLKAAERAGTHDSNGLGHVTPPTPLIIDRPFVYLVRDRATGLVLLAGWFTGPAVNLGEEPDA